MAGMGSWFLIPFFGTPLETARKTFGSTSGFVADKCAPDPRGRRQGPASSRVQAESAREVSRRRTDMAMRCPHA